MECGSPRDAAVDAHADCIAHDPVVVRGADLQEVEAMTHEIVLSPRLPVKICLTTVLTRVVCLDRLEGEDLNRTKHHRPARTWVLVAIPHVHFLVCQGRQVRAEPIWDQDSVRIHLQGPVML